MRLFSSELKLITPPSLKELKVIKYLDSRSDARITIEWNCEKDSSYILSYNYSSDKEEMIEIPCFHLFIWGFSFPNLEKQEGKQSELIMKKVFPRFLRQKISQQDLSEKFIFCLQELKGWYQIKRLVVTNVENRELFSENLDYFYKSGWKLFGMEFYLPTSTPCFSLCCTLSDPSKLLCFQRDSEEEKKEIISQSRECWQVLQIKTSLQKDQEVSQKMKGLQDSLLFGHQGYNLADGGCLLFIPRATTPNTAEVHILYDVCPELKGRSCMTPMRPCSHHCKILYLEALRRAWGLTPNKYSQCTCSDWIFDPTSLHLYEVKIRRAKGRLSLQCYPWELRISHSSLVEIKEGRPCYQRQTPWITSILRDQNNSKWMGKIKKGYIFLFFPNFCSNISFVLNAKTGKLIWEKGIYIEAFLPFKENLDFNVFEWKEKTYFVVFANPSLWILNFQGKTIHRDLKYGKEKNISKLDFFGDKVFCTDLSAGDVYFLPLSLWLSEILSTPQLEE